jgi:glycosyltransferase involved in cell wall biosynthesis
MVGALDAAQGDIRIAFATAMKRILHLLGTAREEGTSVARIVQSLAQTLDPSRYRIEACFLDGDGPLAAEMARAGIAVDVLRWNGGMRNAAGAYRFLKRLAGRDYAIVHQHYGGRSAGWIARRATAARLVTHLHGRVIETKPAKHLKVTPDADAVIACSAAVARCISGIPVVVVYPCVVRPEAETPQPRARAVAEGPVIGTVGRLVAIKGIDHLLRATALLVRDYPHLRCEIAGAGRELERLRQKADVLGIASRVSFLGWRSDPAADMRRWSVFVLPSLEEGFGIALLEAMACGVPVAASNIGGVPELITHGVTGWLMPPADDAAIARRIDELLRDPTEAERVAGAAQRFVREHFSPLRMAAEVGRIYDRLIAQDAR